MLDAIVEQLILILRGLTTTLSISVLSFLVGLGLGIPLAFMRTYGSRPLQVFVDVFEKVFRGIPELVLMLLFFFGVGLYIRFPFKIVLFTAVFALGLRSAANQSQIFRGAIRGVGEEQFVAARSLGLSRLKSIIYVLIPQVFIFSTPGMGSEYALLVKDSSYSWVIGAADMLEYADRIRKATNDLVTPYVLAAFLYILLTFPIATWLDTWGSRKKKELGL
jgi:polar amino acid transport system permease protein